MLYPFGGSAVLRGGEQTNDRFVVLSPLYCVSRLVHYYKMFLVSSRMHVSRRVLLCSFTHFGLHLAHVEISKTSYNSEQREYLSD